jgi:hypothetical protein
MKRKPMAARKRLFLASIKGPTNGVVVKGKCQVY